MSTIDWNTPTLLSNARTEVLPFLNAKCESAAKQLVGDTHSNLPVGAVKRVDANGEYEFQTWSGVAWSALVPKVSTALKIAQDLADLNSASTARTNLGLGSLSTKSTINNADWNGTALALANGGTGATSASAARSALGLGDIATKTSPLGVVDGGTGATAASTARTNLGAAASGANGDITSLTNCAELSDNGAVTIKTTTNNSIYFGSNNLNRFELAGSGVFRPTEDNSRSIGDSSHVLSSIYSVGIQGISSANFTVKGQSGRGIDFIVDGTYTAMRIIGTSGGNYLQVYNQGGSSSKNPANDAPTSWWEIRDASGNARYIPLYAA